jgi:hypothetical protein
MTRYYWTGICREGRNSGISRLVECINKYGSVINSNFFSDLSMSLTIEISENQIKPLYNNLKDIIEVFCDIDVILNTSTDSMILFNIAFTKGTGNLRIEVLEVPG